MKNSIRSNRTRLAALVVVAAAALVVAAASAAPVVNGDFQTGTLAGWTTFTTATGSIGTPAVVSFDTTGTGASLAARFNVGRTVPPFPGQNEGGGIFQSVATPQGVFSLSADIASFDQFGGGNAACGLFELLVDGGVVASHDFGGCPGGLSTVRFALKATSLSLSAGAHEVRVRITRPYLTGPTDSPLEYVDNVQLVPSCAGLNATISGSGVLMGTPGDDVIVGSSGNDVIFGGGGNDTICGGQGRDVIFGDAGNDRIFGDDGTSPTNPAAVGGNDTIYGGDGNDTIDGEAGPDAIWAGANDDTVTGGVGKDAVYGEAGNDGLTGAAGDDSLDGAAGNDVLTGSAGSDALFGGAGNDTLNGDLGPTPPGTLDPVANSDSCDGGADTDTAVFCEAVSNVP